MVSGRGLSSGLLVRRGAAEPLLPGRHPAQAAEAAQELPDAGEGNERRGLGRGARQAVVDRRAKPAFRDRRNGYAVPVRGVRLVQQVEQARRGLDKVARWAERGIAADRPESDQILALAGGRGVEAKSFRRRIMACELTRRFDPLVGPRHGIDIDWAWP